MNSLGIGCWSGTLGEIDAVSAKEHELLRSLRPINIPEFRPNVNTGYHDNPCAISLSGLGQVNVKISLTVVEVWTMQMLR